jgi:Cu(I)/Ag(I) efflux system membrane protein CusA/SilA
VEEAKKAVREKVALPHGVSLIWSGQYENMVRTDRQLKVLVPATLVLVFLLIYFSTKSITETSLVLLAIPFSLVGAVWILWLLDYNLSVAVYVGLIALAGLDAETGVVMLLYLNMAYAQAKKDGKLGSFQDLVEAVLSGAVQRLRPKLMTVAVNWFGLLPVLLATGIGADVMKRIGAPLFGGVLTSFLLVLLVYPAFFLLWKWNTEVRPMTEGVEPSGVWKWLKRVG